MTVKLILAVIEKEESGLNQLFKPLSSGCGGTQHILPEILFGYFYRVPAAAPYRHDGPVDDPDEGSGEEPYKPP